MACAGSVPAARGLCRGRGLAQILIFAAGVGARPGQIRIGRVGGPNLDQASRRVKSEMRDAPLKKMKKENAIVLQPHLVGGNNCGYNWAYNHAW